MSNIVASRKKVFISAGEASGHQVAQKVMYALKQKYSQLDFFQLGGEAQAIQKKTALFPLKKLALNGIQDVIFSLPFLLKVFFVVKHWLLHHSPDLVILIDYPGLNRKLLKLCKKHHFPVYYISPPQVWAYKKKNIHDFNQVFTHVLFPMDIHYYQQVHAQVTQAHFFQKKTPSSPKNKRLILLLPGSRLSILKRNLPLYLKFIYSSQTLDRHNRYLVVVPPFLRGEASILLKAFSFASMTCDFSEAIEKGEGAIAFPGTNTLELALAGIPTYVLGVIDPPTYYIGKMLLKTKYISLPNILLNSPLFLEHLTLKSRITQVTFDQHVKKAFEEQPSTNILWEAMGQSNGAQVAVEQCLKLLASS